MDQVLLHTLNHFLIDAIIKKIIFGYLEIYNKEILDKVITHTKPWIPNGIAVTNKQVFISNTKNNKIMVFDKNTSELLYTFGKGGKYIENKGFGYYNESREHYVTFNLNTQLLNNILFNRPIKLIIDKKILYVLDMFNCRIQMFKIHDNKKVSFHSCFYVSDHDYGSSYSYDMTIFNNRIYTVENKNIRIYSKRDYNLIKCLKHCYKITGIIVDKFNIFLSSKQLDEIIVCNKEKLSIIQRLKIKNPGCISMHNNEIFIIDTNNNKIQIYDKLSLKFIKSIEVFGRTFLSWITIHNDEIYAQSKLTNLDTNNYSVCVFKRLYN
jgi:hypothetical protein